MKNIIKFLILALTVAAFSFSLIACNPLGSGDDQSGTNDGGNQDGSQSGNQDDEKPGDGTGGDAGSNESTKNYYTVTLDDGSGNAVVGVQVKLTDADGNDVAKTIVGMSGERVAGRADFVSVTSGSYAISLVSVSGSGIYYDPTDAKIDENERNVVIKVHKEFPESYRELMGPALETNIAVPSIDVGYYFGTMKEGLNYFLFEPTRSGVYEFKVKTDGVNVEIGNYGIPDYVLSENVEIESDGSLSIEIPPLVTEGGCPVVVGVSTDTEVVGYVDLVRVSDLPPNPNYDPWVTILPTVELKPFDLSYDNAALTSLDITDPDLTVVLGDDGYYHVGSADGEIVYVYVSKPVVDGYLDAAFTTIAGLQMVGHYVYDEDGNFLRKESFNDMLLEYAKYCDSNTGVYPLTEDLAYAIKSFGKSQGWFMLNNEMFNIFGEDASSVVAENAWLFACATFSYDEELGTTAANPLSLYSDGKIRAEANVNYYFNVLGESITVTIKDREGVITVYANGTTYTAEGGEIEFTLQTAVTFFYVSATTDILIEYTSNIQ